MADDQHGGTPDALPERDNGSSGLTPILFDLDGTLIDVSARHYFLYRSVISGQGVEALPEGDFWRHRRAGASTACPRRSRT